MPLVSDLHVHSVYSCDSEARMEDLCEAAIRAGLQQIAFTEHMDFIVEEEDTGSFCYVDYMDAVARCRKQFSPTLTIIAGIEVDYTGDYRNDAIAFVRDHAFDFTIGAVHYLETANISEPRADEYFQTHSAEDAYTAYFAELRSCAETAVFDCIAHPDLIKRFSRPFYGTFDPAPCMDLLTEIMQILIDTGTAMEINTSGLRQGPEDLYPCHGILQLYAGLGGSRVTVGSDAHVPEHVGYGLDRALCAVEEFGFTSALIHGDRTA